MARSQKGQNKEKLSRKEKAELKKEGEKMHEQIRTVSCLKLHKLNQLLTSWNLQIVLPTLVAIFILIAAYVFMKTRQLPIEAASNEE